MKYLKISFSNVEPLRIADDSTSQSGQTASLKYIHGSTIRGMIISRLVTCPEFPQIKKILFSQKVRFLNAYMVNNGTELIPSPKGFYEGKSNPGKLANVLVDDENIEGMKRASLGSYCSVSGNVITYYSVNLNSDIRNKIMIEKPDEKQNVFRYEYIMPGNKFASYIAIEDEKVAEKMFDVVENDFILGNSKSTGLGKCKVIEKRFVSDIPYGEYAIKSDVNNSVYMMLLSDTAMRNEYGEFCGINEEQLALKLGVSGLSIEKCSTSIVNIRGYNRTIGSKLPSVTMYEKGSVFKLSFTGTISADAINEIHNTGIGVRKNEGFGRVLFINCYDKITEKKEGQWENRTIIIDDLHTEDDRVLRVAAKNYYKRIIEKSIIDMVINKPLPKGTLSSSQVGELETRIISNRYNYSEAVKSISDYYGHALKKEEATKVQKKINSIKQLKDFVFDVLNSDLDKILDIKKQNIFGIDNKTLLSEEEKGRYKLQYLLDAIHFDNRKEDR